LENEITESGYITSSLSSIQAGRSANSSITGQSCPRWLTVTFFLISGLTGKSWWGII